MTRSPIIPQNETTVPDKEKPTKSPGEFGTSSWQFYPTQTPILTPSPFKAKTLQVTDSIRLKPSSASTVPVCTEQGGNFEFGSLKTERLGLPMDFRIYLPRCYKLEIDKSYPVLYLFHGQGFTDEQWDRIGADETADLLINMEEIPALIIVMPHERYGGQPNESSFGQVVVEELVPYIDEAYRTIADHKHRAVGGLSRGGGWAIHFGLRYWETFGALGGHSPAVFFSDAEQMRSVIDTIPKDAYPRIYLDIGERDRPEILRAAIWFEQLLNDKGVPHEWHLFSGYHNEDYWKAHMAQYLRWYAQSW
jgi:enterochelin esterase-like enzyme